MKKVLVLTLLLSACNGNIGGVINSLLTPVPTIPGAIATITPSPLPSFPTVSPTHAPVIPPTVIPINATPTHASGTPYSGKCGEVRKYSSNWRVNHYLWKPAGEHSGLATVIVNSSEPLAVSLTKNDTPRTFIKRFNFRSFGSAGWAYDGNSTAANLKKAYGALWVKVQWAKSCTMYFQGDPTLRSDGLKK